MDLRWGGGDVNRIRALAQELVALQPEIILANGTPATAAVQRETLTIPIVFVNVSDPVASGIVERLGRPGGNVTGFANYEASLGGKWLELLLEIAPGLKRGSLPPRDPSDDDNDDEDDSDTESDDEREPAVIREPDKDE
jgi:putative ABC transport system substrate-binding protein